MPFDDIRAALVALLSQPIAVASLILLAGVHAAIWLLVFERVGFPPVLASLLIVPPLTFLLPLYVALARWPSQRVPTFPTRTRTTRARPVKRVVHGHPFTGSPPAEFNHHRPLQLDSNGLPRFRIPLLPSNSSTDWAIRREIRARHLLR